MKTLKENSNLGELVRNELLPHVHKPGQYLGTEFGAVNKDWDSAKSKIAIVYPDLYELGMANFGLKILYNIVNNNSDYLCDRGFAPEQDMEKLLVDKNIPLWGLESMKPLNEFDFLGFSLAYELVYTNVLTMMSLCQIPFKSKDRDESHPLIFAGGPAVFNPEVMADYIDFYLIGDGEEVIIEMQDQYVKSKAEGKNREEVLFDLAQIKGIYVPSFYTPDPEDGYLPKPNREGVPERVEKRVVELSDLNQPTSGPVPYVDVVQDKQTMEIRRGCDRGCRFCQPGYVYLPVRERSPEDLVRLSNEAVKNTGNEDYSLLSLSASDYTCLTEAARAMNDVHAENGISMSMPSQRADRFNVELAAEIQKVRKSGVTLAPEAGTERMRRIINKGLKQDEIFRAIKNVYSEGWSHVKLYYMNGLPFEEDSDLDGILDTLSWAVNMSREVRKTDPKKYKKQLKITCTISTFVPKSFTPFQWFAQCSREEFQRKHKYLQDGIRERGLHKNVKLNCTDPNFALLESVMSRGDRRWGEVVETVWNKGSRLDAWDEHFNVENWDAAAKENGLDLEAEAIKERPVGSPLPWDVLHVGLLQKFLVREWEMAKNEAETLPCTENKCHACGVCFELGVKNIVTNDMSDKNPFVTEIDMEKRKASCASMGEIVEFSDDGLLNEKYDRPIEKDYPETTSGQPIVVRHFESVQRLRLVVTKEDDLRFISHLDFKRMFERAFRRSGLPIVHTVGFNQHMKISWGGALPLFLESEWEYLEIDLAERFEDLQIFKDLLSKELPKQARIRDVQELNAEDKSSINKVFETSYRAELIEGSELRQEDIDSFLARDEIKIEKVVKGKTKTRDLKELIQGMEMKSFNEIELKMKSTQRPDEVLTELLPGSLWRIKKISQKI